MIETTLVLSATLALVQVIKISFNTPKRFTPLMSLVIAMVITTVFSEMPLKDELFTGLLIGLSASGAYDLSKKTVLNIK